MEDKLLELAGEDGFFAAVIPTEQVPVNERFRVFCEQNLCGQYGANYACPPDCGSVEQLHQSILEQDYALVVSTQWDIESYEDKTAVANARRSHNMAVLHLLDKVKAAGFAGFCTGYNGCPLCEPCKRRENQPCAHPDRRISCMSAYCIDVAQLAQRCNLEFDWIPNKLFLFSMIACHRKECL